MIGTIEYHGANQVLSIHDEQRTIPIRSTRFIPGDLVESTGLDSVLCKRQPQTICAVVQSISPPRYHIANLPPVCPFQPLGLELTYKLQLGARILVWLDAAGGERGLYYYSPDPRDDILCIMGLYTASLEIPDVPVLMSRPPLYTRDDIVDHTELDTFTIDPTDSTDFDDAISVEADHTTVYVHIVDIAHADLTKEETARLRNRCLTLYLANEHVEHLLDPDTASDRLSLIAGTTRATITVKLVLADGKVTHYEIYRSRIRVGRRYNYEEVAALIAANTAPASLQYLDRLAAQRS